MGKAASFSRRLNMRHMAWPLRPCLVNCFSRRMVERKRVAFDFLEKAADLGARNKRMWESDKDFETIKDHQRFKALLERI